MAKNIELGFFIKNLTHPSYLKRLKEAKYKSQLLRKSFGKLAPTDTILDCTVGFGKDLLCIASWGYPTTGFERNLEVFNLLSAAFNALKDHPLLAKIVRNISLHHSDSKERLSSLENPPSHVYIDPIYPTKKNTALGKSELRQLKEIVGHDRDSDELLEKALKVATKKVIVKRPLKGELLLKGKMPSQSLKGSTTRYDIYVIK